MTAATQTIIDLETKFWQSMVDKDTDAALEMLAEPSLMVGTHGAMKFDHASFRKMSEQGAMVVKSYEFSDTEVFFPNPSTALMTYRVKQHVAPRATGKEVVQEMNDTSTWVKSNKGWQCVMHTETPVEASKGH